MHPNIVRPHNRMSIKQNIVKHVPILGTTTDYILPKAHGKLICKKPIEFSGINKCGVQYNIKLKSLAHQHNS